MIKGQALSMAVVSATLPSPKVHQICKLAEDALPGNSLIHNILCLVLKLETLFLCFWCTQSKQKCGTFPLRGHLKNLEPFILVVHPKLAFVCWDNPTDNDNTNLHQS